ncbi:MAG: right-handed parallel beta-helix repeat-containing protein, partial [Planctomycetes bacterium]|nr:right-handed parallel beta-helix repeat-containing protein [Planctomycetota bacterium]
MSMRSLAIRLATCMTAIVVSADAAVIKVSKNGALTTIQAGIDAASAGDVVQIGAGVYSEILTVDVTRVGITLKAKGKVVLDALGPLGVGLGPAITVEAASVRLQGLTIRNAGSTGNFDGIGILALGSNIRVEKCSVSNCDDFGVVLAAAGGLLSRCVFRSLVDAIAVDGGNGSVIDRCVVRGVDGALKLDQGTSVVVDRLDVRQCESNAVEVGATNTGGFVLRDSKFECVSETCVVLEGDDALIESNRFRSVGGALVLASNDCIVRDNRIDFVTSFGAAFSIGTTTNTRVEANVIRDCATAAILLESTSTGAILSDNVVLRAGDENFVAYQVFGTNHVLERERVSFAGGDAFRLDGIDHELFDCVALDAAVDGFDVLSSADFVSLDGCLARRCAAEGLENSGTLTNFN